MQSNEQNAKVQSEIDAQLLRVDLASLLLNRQYFGSLAVDQDRFYEGVTDAEQDEALEVADAILEVAATSLAAERDRADRAEQERDDVMDRLAELRDSTDADRYGGDDALMLRGHRAIDAEDQSALTWAEWATFHTTVGRNGGATRVLDHLAAIVSLRGAEYDLYSPPELAAIRALSAAPTAEQ